MINKESDISRQYYSDEDLKSIPLVDLIYLRNNPYMSDMVKMDKKNPQLSWEIEICHKAWLEGAVLYLAELTKLREHANDGKDLMDGLDDEPDTKDLDKEFLHNLLEDYRVMLQQEYDYLTSKDAVIETINANEYDFTEDGKLWKGAINGR
jgi:hypothetical protein